MAVKEVIYPEGQPGYSGNVDSTEFSKGPQVTYPEDTSDYN